MKFWVLIIILLFPIWTNGQTMSDSVSVKTLKEYYAVGEPVTQFVTNKYNSSILFFICDQFPNLAPHKIVRLNGEEWEDYRSSVACTSKGPAGYIGPLGANQQILDNSISISEVGTYKIYFDFTFRGSEEGDKLLCSSNIFNVGLSANEDITEAELKVFPNPINKGDLLYVTIPYAKSIRKLELYNNLGVLILSRTSDKESNLESINSSAIQKGLYYLKIFDDTKNYTQSVLIR